jgi:hypothetical protein
MTLINDYRPAPQPEYTRPVPRYTLAILNAEGRCEYYVELKPGQPEPAGVPRLALLQDGLIIASAELEQQ